jgi:tetratricopeptide (TPR) repeat protein
MKMNDVVLQGLISNAFWLTIFLVAVGLFRNELKLLLRSLSKFNVAGASFELKDATATIEYYAVLTNVLVGILSQRDLSEKFFDLVSAASAQQLAKFIQQYQKEVKTEDKNIELMKNIALLVGRKGHYNVAISVYDELLKENIQDRDLLRLKARMLRESRIEENIKTADHMFDDLVKRYPKSSDIWFGRARTKCLLGQLPESIADIKKAIELGYGRSVPNMLENEELQLLRDQRPNDVTQLREELRLSQL